MRGKGKGLLMVSNNPAVWQLFADNGSVPESLLDAMREARNRLHHWWKFINHPLMGSIHLLRNPYRPVVLGTSEKGLDCNALFIVEDIYWRLCQTSFDISSDAFLSDYQAIDLELLKTVVKDWT